MEAGVEQRHVQERKNLVRSAWGETGVVVDSRHIVAAGEAAGSTVLVEQTAAGNRRSCRKEGLGKGSSLLAAEEGSTVVAVDTVAEERRIQDRCYSLDILTFLP
jgi:hypothetical protein